MSENYYYAPIHEEILCEHKKARGYQTYPYHRHNGYEIYLFIQGNILLYIEQDCYRLSPGDIIIIPPTSRHRIVSLDDRVYERIVINIKQSAAEKLSTSRTDLFACFYSCLRKKSSLSHLDVNDRSLFIDYADQLSQALSSDEYGSDITSHILSSQILLFINKHYYTSTTSGWNIMLPLVKDVMKYIQDNLAEKLTLEKLSKEFYLNGTYLSRLFKKHVGLSLREYILDQRIDFAKQLLSAGCSVSEACYTSGFHDYSNFIRSFTKIVGISPGKYKKTVKENTFL